MHILSHILPSEVDVDEGQLQKKFGSLGNPESCLQILRKKRTASGRERIKQGKIYPETIELGNQRRKSRIKCGKPPSRVSISPVLNIVTILRR